MLAVTQVMAAERYNDVELLSILGEPAMSLEKALLKLPAGKRLLAKKEQEIERKTIRKNILSLLETRFGSAPKSIARQLSAIDDPKELDELFRSAATCASLAAFGAALENS